MIEYQRLHSAFENYLKNGPSVSNESNYSQSLTSATSVFKNVSEAATNIKLWLISQSSTSISSLASHIENIQNLEKKRLELTISYQLTRGYSVDQLSETDTNIPQLENGIQSVGNGNITTTNGIANLTVSDVQDQTFIKDQEKLVNLKAEIDNTVEHILNSVQALREDAEDYLLDE